MAHLGDIIEHAKCNPNLDVLLYCSQEGNRLTLADLVASLDAPKNTIVSFCGPEIVLEELFAGLSKHGVKRKNLRYEEFVLGSGLPLRTLSKLIAPQLRRLAIMARNLFSRAQRSTIA